MTAPLGTAANVFTGLREYGQVTNSYGGYLQSAGSAYSLVLPFQPDRLDWFRYTAFGTAGTLGQGVWFRDFPAGDSLIIRSIADNGVTGNTSLLLETSNGITYAPTTGGFTDEHKIITGISSGVVTTSTAHGLATNDRVVLTQIVGTVASELNNNTYVVLVQSSNTFKLYDTYGLPITQSGSYTSGGQVTRIGPDYDIENSAPSFILTLGTSIMGADNDVIYFTAWQFNNYVNLGDVA